MATTVWYHSCKLGESKGKEKSISNNLSVAGEILHLTSLSPKQDLITSLEKPTIESL